jgi:hypothetical protein
MAFSILASTFVCVSAITFVCVSVILRDILLQNHIILVKYDNYGEKMILLFFPPQNSPKISQLLNKKTFD